MNWDLNTDLTDSKVLPTRPYLFTLWINKYFWLIKLNALGDVHSGSGDIHRTKIPGYLQWQALFSLMEIW